MAENIANNTAKRAVIIIGVVVAVLLAALFYVSPLLTMNSLKNAALAKDTAKVSKLVDFPSLRESIKSQMLAALTKQLQSEEAKNDPFAGMAAAMGGAMVNNLVDAFVTPEGITNLVEHGEFASDEKSNSQVEPLNKAETQNQGVVLKDKPAKQEKDPKNDIDLKIKWLSLSAANVTVINKNSPDKPIVFELKRSGILSWQVKGIDLPEEIG